MKKSDARKKTEKNMFFSRKKHEMKKTVFFTTLVMAPVSAILHSMGIRM